ncbi:twin transmembrane helix small protein [Sneathiella sp.]|uniref:twin transmembrane helix small protein n=1 Tax=Sneathiella sp. TaxID=1964365 RepID=UPI003568820A
MLNYFIIAAVVATGLVLLFGVLTMARGGEFNRRNANKIMRLRILMQGIAIALILIGLAFSGVGK